MVKGPALAGPSERSERFEPLVRPRHGLEPATLCTCSAMLAWAWNRRVPGLRLERAQAVQARTGRSFTLVNTRVFWCKWFGPDSYRRREVAG